MDSNAGRGRWQEFIIGSCQGSDATVFRRDHAYFWYPVSHATNAPVAFQIDPPGTTTVLEQNSIEGIHGVGDRQIIELKRR